MGSTHVHTARRAGAGAAALIAALALTACSGGDDDAAAIPATDGAAATSAAGNLDAPVPLAERSSAPDAAAADQSASLQVAGPSIAITAHAVVQSDDVRTAVDRITATVASHGGRVASADIDYGQPTAPGAVATATARLAVEVPPAELEAIRRTLTEVGDVRSFDQQAEDVADQLTDLDTRIANQRASVARIRELYAGATDVESIVRIEGELTNRETALEQLLATQANLQDRVAMSTLTIELSTTAVTPTTDRATGIGDALGAGWRAFAGALFAIALVLTAAMPFLLLASAIFVGAWLLLKSSRGSRNAPTPGRGESAPLSDEELDALASRQG